MVKAIRFEKPGGTEVLEYKDIELAPPGPGQVRVKHSAIGVNFIDIYHRTGLYPLPLPSGRIAVFAARASETILLHESGMRDLAVDEEVEINLGDSPAVEVTARKAQAYS